MKKRKALGGWFYLKIYLSILNISIFWPSSDCVNCKMKLSHISKSYTPWWMSKNQNRLRWQIFLQINSSSKDLVLFQLLTFIYIYIYIGVCVCVCVCSISTLLHIWLNDKDIFCLHNFTFVLLRYRIDFYDIRRYLINKTSIINFFPSTFCPILGHHYGCVYCKSDVTFACTLQLNQNEPLYWCILSIATAVVYRTQFF